LSRTAHGLQARPLGCTLWCSEIVQQQFFETRVAASCALARAVTKSARTRGVSARDSSRHLRGLRTPSTSFPDDNLQQTAVDRRDIPHFNTSLV